ALPRGSATRRWDRVPLAAGLLAIVAAGLAVLLFATSSRKNPKSHQRVATTSPAVGAPRPVTSVDTELARLKQAVASQPVASRRCSELTELKHSSQRYRLDTSRGPLQLSDICARYRKDF